MGYYISITEKETGKNIIKNKYGVGFAMLIFDDYEKGKDNKDVIFSVDGKKALSNLDDVIAYLTTNINVQNYKKVTSIQESLQQLRKSIDEDKTYICDYREALCIVESTDFDPLTCLEEFRNKLEDAVNGYSHYGEELDKKKGKMLKAYITNLSDEIGSCMVVKETSDYVVLQANIRFNEKDLLNIKRGRIHNDADNYEYEKRYAERKLFYILKETEFEFELCNRTKNVFYIILSSKSVKKWYDTNPYVECYYQLTTTHPISYLVRNTPKEKEKFYHIAKSHSNLEKVVIDGVDLTGSTKEEVSTAIGKPFCVCNCKWSEIDMIPADY